jgi:hypothetical protein
MPQGPISVLNFLQNITGGKKSVLPAQADAQGNAYISGLGGNKSALYLNGTTPQQIKVGPGAVVRAVVLVAGSGTGAIYDAATTASAITANEIATIPETIGPIELDFPVAQGIVVSLGTGQAVSLSYY